MEKFTKVVKKEDKKQKQDENSVVFQNEYMTVKNTDDYTYVIESDRVVCLPYIKDEGYVYLRAETIPPWMEKYKNTTRLQKTTQFLTVMSGTIENGEDPKSTLRRELYEEIGISLNQFYNIELEGPYFESKGNTSQFYICLMELSLNDYKIVAAPGDGTKYEKVAKNLKVSIADLDEIRINDMATRLLIEKLKRDYNL